MISGTSRERLMALFSKCLGFDDMFIVSTKQYGISNSLCNCRTRSKSKRRCSGVVSTAKALFVVCCVQWRYSFERGSVHRQCSYEWLTVVMMVVLSLSYASTIFLSCSTTAMVSWVKRMSRVLPIDLPPYTMQLLVLPQE